MPMHKLQARPEEETRHELEDARKAFSDAQERLTHAKRRAEIRERLNEIFNGIATVVKEADALEAELLTTDHLFAVHEIEFIPVGYPDTSLTVDDGLMTIYPPQCPTVEEVESVTDIVLNATMRTETPIVAPEPPKDDPTPAKVSRVGYKHIPGQLGQPPRELPPAPKNNVVNYCKSKKYPIHVTLEGDLAALDISWTEDDGLVLDKDGYADPDEAYEDAKDTAMAAAGVGAEGQIKVWADVGAGQPAMILWHYNGAN